MVDPPILNIKKANEAPIKDDNQAKILLFFEES